jgi:uncharacterized protein YciI
MTGPRITKDDILAATKGMLQKQLYVVSTSPTGGLGPVMEALKEHLEFLVKLGDDGILLGAGPHWADDEHTWNGEGMVILRADSLAHANELASRDPMHSSGARKFTVRPWLLNEGGINVRLDFSTVTYSVD